MHFDDIVRKPKCANRRYINGEWVWKVKKGLEAESLRNESAVDSRAPNAVACASSACCIVVRVASPWKSGPSRAA